MNQHKQHKRAFYQQRKFIIIAIIIVILLMPLIYIIIGVNVNLQKMKKAYSVTYNFPTYPTPNLTGKTAAEIALIKRGDYLVKAGDCIACHTNTVENNPPFSGGLPMQTPFGVIYTPNITADKETGIGTWSDEQFIKAMREGIAPNGDYYYPAFPFIYFNKVNDDDLKAIKAYLENIPTVHLKNRDNDMVFPFNWRFLQLGWRILFFHNGGPYQADPQQSAAWNRGAYLVEGLGHCAMCHTPSYHIITENVSLGAPILKHNLTGANIQGYLAPNITKTNLGAIPDNELLRIFTNYELLGGGTLQGPMLEAVHDSLIHLSREDLLAMIVYLKTVESEMPRQPYYTESGLGETIYNSYCSGCHSTGVGGAPKVGNAASWGPLARSGINKLYAIAINGGGNMPARGTCIKCSDYEIKLAVDYMVAVTLKKVEEKQQKDAAAQVHQKK